ncbi:MAG TPA: hypothetical protein VGE40_14145 [Bacilli bacterium]
MTDQNKEMMSKIIEAKKKKSAEQGGPKRGDKVIGKKVKAFKQFKKGGLFG